MAKKQTAKERREAQWKKTLENRLKKSKKEDTYESMATVVQIDKKEEEEERAQLEEIENTMSDSKKFDSFESPNYSILKEVFPTDTEVKKMKKKLSKSQVQIAAEKIEDQEVLPLTDVILDENMADERQAIVAKMQKLLKRRYSLTSIADALQTNNYEKLDEVIEQREEIISEILKIDAGMNQESDKRIRMFSRFKFKVGEDNSRLYVEQENRMKVLLEYISQGEYIEKAKKRLPDAITDYIEPSEEYGMLKSEMQKWKDGKLSENQIRQLVENIVNFSIGCKEFYGNVLTQEDEEEKTMSESTLQISSQMVQFSNSVIEKYNKIYGSTSSKDIYNNILEIFESGIQEIENTILRAETQYSYEDVVANIVDNPNFNAACKIETAYFSYELDRAAKILESFEGRAELADTVEKCKKLRNVIKSREEAYMTIEELVAGKSRPTLKVDIKDENEGR